MTASNTPGRAGFLAAHRPFIVVWLALFISIAGVSMVSPLMPVFAEDMGASGVWLGLAFSGFAITQVPLMPVVGRLSDRFGKRFFLWSGLLVYAMAALGYYWSPTYHELILFRLLSGVGAAMVIPTSYAFVGELAPFSNEGRYMGLFNIALIAGFGLGPAVGGLVHDSFGMDATFACMGLLSIFGFLVVFLFLPKTRSLPVSSPSGEVTGDQQSSSSLVSMLKDEILRGVVTFQLMFGLLFGAVLSFVGIWMTTMAGSTVTQVGLVLSARVITNAILVYPFGWLADRIDRVLLASAAMFMVVIGTFSVSWLQSFTPLLLLFMLIGLFESMAIPSINAITVGRGRDLGMGSVMGLFNMSMSVGMVAGSLLGGMIESFLGIGAVFRYVAIPGLAGVALFVFFMRQSNRPYTGTRLSK